MANYNNSQFLEEALKSIFEQSYTNWEVILIDDASTDDFEDVISKFRDNDRIKVYRNTRNKGCAYTKSRCIEKAKGIIAGFLDPDDTLHPDALKIMIEAHTQKPGCSIIHATHYVCDDKLNIKKLATCTKALPENTPYLLLNDGSIHAFATFKKVCYDRTDGISLIRNEDKAIDQELYYLLEEEGDVFFINSPLYYYRIHKGSISNMGNERATTNAHYSIIEEACLRRIKKLKQVKQPDAKYWIKKYRTRYYKISIFNSFRRKRWLHFFICLVVFPFVGGLENLNNYFRKIPKEGFSLIRKSFANSYKILE